MLRKTFRVRLIIIFLIITSIPLGFIGIMMEYGFNTHVLNLYNQDILHQLKNETSTADLWFGDRIQILKTIGEAVELMGNQGLSQQQMDEFLTAQKKHAPEFFTIFFTLEDGKTVATLERKAGVDFRERDWYQRAKEKEDVIISEPYDDINTGVKVITISLPIFDKTGKLLGIMGGDLDFESVTMIIQRLNITGETQHFIFNPQGRMLWNDLYEGKPRELSDKELMELEKNAGNFISIDRDEEHMIGTYIKMASTGWQIAVLSSVEDYFLFANEIKYIFFALTTITIVIMLIAVFMASKQIAKPMEELRDAAQQVSVGNFNIQFKQRYEDEIGEVMAAFHQMAATIRHNYQSLTNQARQLMDGNKQLQDMNIELELSFEQLQEMNMELEASNEQLLATSEQLNYSEQKFRLLVENITDLVWIIDEEGIITYINDMIEETLGYTKEEVVGKSLWSILCPLHQYDRCSNIIMELKEKDYKHLDLWMLAKDGKTRLIIETNTKKVYQNEVFVGIQGIGRDVTDYVRMKQQLLRKNEELTVFNELSHSLTNTISTIKTETLLNNIVNRIVNLMGDIAICSIRLLENEKELVLKASAGTLEHLVTRRSLHIDEDGMGIAVKEKRLIVMNELDRRYISSYNQKFLDMQEVNHVVFIPLKIEDNVIGVMAVSSETKVEEDHIYILNAISNHAAVAIEKARLYNQLKESYFRTIKALAMAVEAKDTYTQGHSNRVSQYAVLIGKQLGLEESGIEALEVAGILHDIGKIGIREAILTKPGQLDWEEFKHIMEHPVIGSRILNPIGLSDTIMEAILLHHKRYDLQGYPKEIHPQELPLYAEIIGVSDAFDAMISKRSYKAPMSIEEAMEELKRCSGTQFGPKIVEAMEEIYGQDLEAIRKIAST